MAPQQNWTDRFERVIPWGSSTCSKVPAFLPEEPQVIVRGKGCRVWDDEGRQFIDFRNAMGPVTLGYCHPAIDDAITRQLRSGIVFGHPHPLECEVAEMLCSVIPCAEQARFLKTGGEAVAACIRASRTYTGREHVIQIGYNGWLNCLAPFGLRMPNQRHHEAQLPGVPVALSEKHHVCAWNDVAALEQLFDRLDGQVAGVVVAADYRHMAQGASFYPALRRITEKHGTVLIHDEIVTGFRVALGGVQEYFNVTPDMAVFAKGIANGMPLSAYVGRRELMQTFKRGVVSTTYGGETLSLAAAKAAITLYQEQDVVGFLWRQGERLWTKVNQMLADRHVPAQITGFWPCPIWVSEPTPEQGDPREVLDRLFRAAYRHGLSLYDVSYVNFSHTDDEIDETLRRFEQVCDALAGKRAPALANSARH